jgi:NTE family protein
MNLPISVVRDMGADIVIAVDVGGPRREREEITDVLQMLDQIASLATWRSTEEQIATLKGRDVLIVPPLGRKVLAGDFNKMVEAISIGEQGASTRRFELRHLALPPERYAAYRAAHRPPDYRAPTIDYVRVENRSRLAPEVLESRLDIRPGELLDPVALDSQLATIYDQDNFENVRYRIEQQDGRTGVVVTANEKSWGTSSLQGGMELSSTTGGDSMFNIGAAYTMAPLNQWNGEWRTLFRIGEEPGIFTEIYQPLDPGERWYLQGGVGYLSDNLRLFASSSDKNPIAEYQLSRAGGGVELGRNLGNWGRLGLRYSRFVGDADVRVADPSFQGFDFDIGQIGLQFYLDTLDSLDFPRKGWAGSLLALASRKDLGASSDYDQGSLSLLHALSWDRNSLLAGLQLGGSFGGEAPPQALFRLGGFLNLSGFNQRELSGSNVGIARGIYLRDLGTGLVNTYAGASLELGNVWPQRGDIRFDNSLLAGSVFVGADTLLGPLYLGYGYAEGGHDALYLILGRPWLEPVRGW